MTIEKIRKREALRSLEEQPSVYGVPRVELSDK